MTSSSSVKLVALSFSVFLFVSGCGGDSYPTALSYPPRSDPLVVGKPNQDSSRIDLPGQFPSLFVGLSAAEIDKLLLDPVTKLTASQRQQLDEAINSLFGTPAQPKVDGIEADVRATLRLEEGALVEGSRVYRHQCLHCHGLTGDGHGPTAPWVNPHPRDFRPGMFKFTSTSQAEGERKPRREDLLRTLRDGIEGASMPSFRLLDDHTLEALSSYVIHLSLRGQTEMLAIREIVDGAASEITPERLKNDYLAGFAGQWMAAQSSDIRPGAYAISTEDQRLASVKRGMKLFVEPGDAGCISCHTDYGRQSPWKYDAWGTMVKPADLTRGVYRGGRRPVDLYYRIDSGIAGTGMTAFGKNLKPDQIWDIVNFVQVLPYPKMRQTYGIDIN